MIQYNELPVLLRRKILKIKNKDIIFWSSGQVRVRVGFDTKLYGFFGFGLLRIRVEKILFKTQKFQANSDQFLSGLLVGHQILQYTIRLQV